MDHGVGLRQVQAHAAGFQADQEQRHLAAGELLDQFIALLALPGELDRPDALLFQLGLDQRQHAGELREQQNAPPLSQHLGQQRHQLLQFGRGLDLGRCRQRHQPRVAADLAQLEQGVQNHDL